MAVAMALHTYANTPVDGLYNILFMPFFKMTMAVEGNNGASLILIVQAMFVI